MRRTGTGRRHVAAATGDVAAAVDSLALVLAAGTARLERRTDASDATRPRSFTGGERRAPAAGAPSARHAGRHESPYWQVRAATPSPASPAGRTPSRCARRAARSCRSPTARQDVLARRDARAGLRASREEPVRAQPARRVDRRRRANGAKLAYDVAVRISERRGSRARRSPHRRAAAAARRPRRRSSRAERIQSAAPEVAAPRAQTSIGTATRLDEVVWSLYQYTAAFLPPADPPGPQDAVERPRGAPRHEPRPRARAGRAAPRGGRAGAARRRPPARERRRSSAPPTRGSRRGSGAGWVPLDPAGGFYAALPEQLPRALPRRPAAHRPHARASTSSTASPCDRPRAARWRRAPTTRRRARSPTRPTAGRRGAARDGRDARGLRRDARSPRSC